MLLQLRDRSGSETATSMATELLDAVMLHVPLKAGAVAGAEFAHMAVQVLDVLVECAHVHLEMLFARVDLVARRTRDFLDLLVYPTNVSLQTVGVVDDEAAVRAGGHFRP